MAALIVKHGEQKEAFLKACTLARRTAETFLKYAARSAQVHGQTAAASKAHHDQTRAILDTLLAQENKVRELYFFTFYCKRVKMLNRKSIGLFRSLCSRLTLIDTRR